MKVKNKLISLEKPLVMGIINLTPDSFFKGSRFQNDAQLIEKVGQFLMEGASIIDIGAASSKPGAALVKEEEELERLLQCLQSIIKNFPDAIISVDTYRSNVAKQSITMGAAIINDISAGMFDKEMLEVVSKLNVTYIMMHIKGTPQTMQENPVYENVVLQVLDFFIERIALARAAGIVDLVIDPGFGFGKTVEHNYELLKNLSLFKMLDVPILVGISRKSLINKVLGIKADEALNGTSVLHTLALTNGANIIRVHEVKEAKQVIDLYNFYESI